MLSNKNRGVSFFKTYDNRFNFTCDFNKKKEFIEYEKLINNYSILSIEYYLNDDSLNDTVSLESITIKAFRGVQCSKEELDQFSSIETTDKRFLNYSDIKNGLISDDMQSLLQIDEKYQKYCAKEGDIIISKVCSPLKIAVVENSFRQILVGGNMYVIRLDKNKADPYYVKAFLDSVSGQKQIKKLLSGKKTPALSLQEILHLKINLWDMQRQSLFATAKYKIRLIEIRKKQAELAQMLDTLSHILEE